MYISNLSSDQSSIEHRNVRQNLVVRLYQLRQLRVSIINSGTKCLRRR